MTTSRIARIALLAEASYGHFANESPNRTEISDALLQEKFSASQIADLNSNFSILNYRANTVSGFSATLFQEKGTARSILSFRGTEVGAQLGVDLLSADLGGIVTEGAALYQIVDLYNYWKELTAPIGTSVRIARIAEIDDPNAPGVFTQPIPVGIGPTAHATYRRIEFFDQAGAGLGVITGPVTNLSVTGHSLGGHLATAFQRLFPAEVSAVFTVNGAGTRGSETIDRFFDALAGRSGTSFNSAVVMNLYGSAGPNIVSGELVYTQVGDRGEIFTESIMDVGGHGNMQMTDSAAVYDLFVRADARLNAHAASTLSASLLGLFKAADADASFTLEAIVNSFGRLFIPGYVPISRLATADRDVLHSRIIAIRDVLSQGAGNMRIESIAGMSANELANFAKTDVAYRYALRELNPFAIVNADYASHNTQGHLDPYGATSESGLTDQWLSARSRFLRALIDYNMADGAVNANAIGAHFEDRAQGIAFGPINNTTARIVFGRDDQALVAGGSAVADSLFGGGANDELSGAAGNDHLEGGAGADTLDGGVGNDSLFGGAGDDALTGGGGVDALSGGGGFDTYYAESGTGLTLIRDSDGQGRIVLSGNAVTGGTRQSGNDFRSEDGRFSFSFTGDLAASGTLTIGSDVVVENFHNGDLGILLDGGVSAEPPDFEFEYSRYSFPDNVVFDDQDAAMSALYFGSYANDVFRYGALDPANPSAGAQPGREGPIDSSGSFYRGWGGDDQYLGAYHYGDTFFGDAGDDLILGADLGADYIPVDGRGDSDQLYGGGGSDIIVGGKGNDLLYGDFARVRISGTDPTDLSLVTSVALDTWFAVLSGGRYVSAESRTPFEANLQVDYDDGLGFEVMLRYQLGLGDAQDSDGFFDDFVSGAQGDDRIFGGYGSDTLLGGDGDDFIDGDTPGFSDTNLPLELRPLFGRAGDDFLDGGEGNDDLRDHRGGNDVFLAGAGDDVLSNSDTFAGDEDAAPESVSNYLDGGDGDDTITSYNNSIKGFDHASGGAGNDTITVGSDARFGGGEVSVSGGDGDDHISVGSLNGHVDGGDGDDDIYVEGFEDDLQDDELDGYEGVTVFGGAGNDTISTYGRIDVDGGDGDDIIEWMAAERQTATGFITGGAGNDRIRASGAAIIDAGAGDDEIISMSGESHITPGAGRDRVVVDLSSGRASDIVLDLSGAGPNDELLFKRFPGNGAPAMQVQSDLLIQRAGNDLQLELVRNQGGADAVSEARVLIPDWFSGGAPQLASITVEGMRTWTSADVAALVVVVPEVLPPDFPPQQDVSPTPDVDGAGAMPDAEMITPAIVLAPSVRVENPALSDLLASLGPVAAVPSVSEDTTNSDSSAVTPSAEPGSSESGRDSIEAFLARLADRSEYDFSFVSGLVEGVRQQRTDDFAPRVNPAQLAGQWNALHAYMDALAASPDTDQRIAAPTEPAPGLGALLRTGAGSFEQTGVIETARVGISDSSLAGLRPLQGLTEGFAQLG